MVTVLLSFLNIALHFIPLLVDNFLYSHDLSA